VTEELALAAFYDALRDDDAEQLYDRAPCGYLSTTPDGLIVKVNATFLTWTGYRRQELVRRRRFVDLLTAGGRIYHETHYAPMLQMQGSAREIALDLVRADGSRMPVLLNSVLDRDAAGIPQAVRTAVFDATDRREYERELLRAKQRAEESEARARGLAQTLQQTLIPPIPPQIPGLDVAGAYRPAGRGDEVGGDFYDVFELGDGDWFAVLGDVSGKGAAAAVVTAFVRHTIRAAVARSDDLVEALHIVHDLAHRQHVDRFCSLVLVRLRHDGEWTATLVVAGHPLPLLARPGEQPLPVGAPGSLLGAFPDPEFSATVQPLASGDALLLYTDGVTEGRRGREFYGERRLTESVVRHTRQPTDAVALVHGVVDDVVAFQGGNPRDDIAVLALAVPAEATRTPSA
jgi:sigma-B regulation protein RsbU (phosphoserine phosphatase)